MKIRWLKKFPLNTPRYLNKGDTYSVIYRQSFVDEDGDVVKEVRHRLGKATIDKSCRIDETQIFAFEDHDDLEHGYGSISGQRKRASN